MAVIVTVAAAAAGMALAAYVQFIKGGTAAFIFYR
jgi:hypothetical protein